LQLGHSAPHAGVNLKDEVKFAGAILLALSLALLARARTSQSPAASIGLPVGESAPAFLLHDQFGREQSNETLKGPHGTVILFFRSADW
jgi:hypothetical protein